MLLLLVTHSQLHMIRRAGCAMPSPEVPRLGLGLGLPMSGVGAAVHATVNQLVATPLVHLL